METKTVNKYTRKIKDFIDKHYYRNIIKNHDDNEIIKNIGNSFDNIIVPSYSLVDSFEISKSNDYSNKSLIYSALLDLYNSGKIDKSYFGFDPNNFKLFIDWIRKEIKSIDLKILFKDTKYYDIFFDPPVAKKILFNILYSNIFISLDSIHHIECEDLIYEHYKKDNINVHIHYLKRDDHKIDVDMIFKIIYFFRTFFKSEKHLDIYCILGKQKKFISKFDYLCSDNINSGLCAYDKYIMIWRKEEFYKVLIHELCHYYHVDYHVDNTIYKYFKKMINVQCDLFNDAVNESFNESIALIIHSIIYSVVYKKSFTYIFNYEVLFTQFQISKILNHMEMDKLSDILIKPVKQTTSVISYYIIKYLFIVNIQTLLNYIEENGFITQDKNNFFKLYTLVFNEDSINSVNLEKQFELFKYKENKFIYNTLCMAMFQLSEK